MRCRRLSYLTFEQAGMLLTSTVATETAGARLNNKGNDPDSLVLSHREGITV